MRQKNFRTNPPASTVAFAVQEWTNLLAQDDDKVHANITLPDPQGEAPVYEFTTGITQPDYPRNVIITGIPGDTTPMAGDVVIYGRDVKGNRISDTIALDDDSVVPGVKCFKSIDRITAPELTNAADAIKVGYGVLIGLEDQLEEDSILQATCLGVKETRPTVNIGTTPSTCWVTFSTSPDGANDYALFYMVRN